MARDLWVDVLDRIRHKVNPSNFSTWFKPARLLSRDAGCLTVEVPNPLFAEWLKSNYQSLIAETVQEVDGKAWEVVFTSAEGPSRAAPVPALGPQFCERYTFENFVVGEANRFARAAAKAVANAPAMAHNPLYLHGGTGLGKTHLMQAIGNALLGSNCTMRVKYVSAETFVNEMINAIRFGKTQEFKDRYRRIDVLLIDDIQFLAGKDRTQEEFFHTFNALHQANRQIVLTSDCVPQDIPKLEERLLSRFQWGLLADLKPPDLETRIAILGKKASTVGFELPTDVALLIATKVKSNVRELEGALNRLCAYAAHHSRPVSLELVKEALKDVLPVEQPVITIESIQKVVADHYRLKVADLKARNNSRQVALPRQIAMSLSKTLTPMSLPEIGRRFGKHHSTVIHAIRKIEQKRQAEPDFDRLLTSFAQRFQ